jgi:mRNA-degrading endonuclease toxin of MazEF toxin-antitoxin module
VGRTQQPASAMRNRRSSPDRVLNGLVSRPWWVALDPAVGSESKKKRPCLVVRRDAANAASPTTIVCPIAAAKNSVGDILNVIVGADSRLTKASRVVCNQIRVVDLQRFGIRLEPCVGFSTLEHPKPNRTN